ncbi:MerC domain-containing protein [Marinilongibacter aquaticus]|uniref:MerC domain-containing protein n=1 Tax=Marinilongibacter aquaticus TaxID=2975157 RepID=UPI0021BD6449|nr:MerC domain-containing protein [Marinilongibacter aquaticus]UBM57809.1 MerC domain-containing protein [Marinilongibacter aquaticus]
MAKILYKFGLGMSVLCAIHCLAMPFVLVFMPILAEEFLSESMEMVLVGSSLVLGVIFLLRDYRIYQMKSPLGVFSLSVLFFVAHLFSQNHLWLSLGSFTMAAAYLLNWYWQRKACSH